MRKWTWMVMVTGVMLAAQSAMAAVEAPVVRITTNLGAIELTMDAEQAPNTVANFLRYVKEGFYDGTIFHRVIKGFMIQGGGFTPELFQKSTHAPIANEADNGLHNGIGAVAMARTSDPDSATAQFFINTHDNGFLDFRSRSRRGWGYAVFAHVTGGMDVVRRIEAVATGNMHGMGDVPLHPVVIEHAEVVH